MKKSLKALVLTAVAGALIVGSAFTASAAAVLQGQWCSDQTKGWWYKLNAEGSSFIANSWYWIKDTDGVIRCYYFDQNGWLKTNTTIDGEQVDADGRWVVNGQVQTKDAASTDYAETIVFPAASSGASTSKKASTSALAGGRTGIVSAKKAVKKVGGQGDNPGSVTFAPEYTNSTVSGNTVTNAWANFSITLPGIATVDTSGAGTDWYYDTDDGNIYSAFFKLDKYAAGNADLTAFINRFVTDKGGFYGGQITGTATYGGLTYVTLRAETPDPRGTMYDYAYVRVVDGTNYVQIIVCDTNGGSDFASSIATIKTVV